MRLHALILALSVLGAYAASIPDVTPDKKDIEKKLAAVVKEVLNKDDAPIDNVSSAQELIEQTDEVKDVENNLRKSAQPSDIPVKVVVEEVQPTLKADDKKEDNEVSPQNEEDIVRPEPDLKNPGPPQRMQHDTQNPETFVDALQIAVLKNSEWRASEQYATLQKEIKELKENFENKMTELYGSLQEHWNTHPGHVNDVQKEENIVKLRASVRQDTSSSSSSSSSSGGAGSGSGSSGNSTNPWGSGPFGGFFQNWAQSFTQNLQNLNQTVNNYWNNNTNSNSNGSDSGNQCGSGGSGGNIFSWGNNNPLNFGQQQGTGQQSQSDEPARPGLWQSVTNFFQGAGQQPAGQQPAGAQSDTPQPVQPNRPVIQAFQNVIQQAGSYFNRPGQAQGQQPDQQPQQPAPAATQEGSNIVPTENKPEKEVEKPPQQSGPIKQMIGNNPVVQGIAGAVQRIQHTVIPPKPRDEVKSAVDTEAQASQATKGGFFPPRPGPPGPPGDNNSDINRVEVKEAPEMIQEPFPAPEPAPEPTKEEAMKEEPMKEEPMKEKPIKEDSPMVQDKTE